MLGRARRRTLLVDAGRPRNAVSASVNGFLSRDGIDPAELRRIAHEQLTQYDTVEILSGAVSEATMVEMEYALLLADGQRHTARRLLLATGAKDELPPIDGLTDQWGRGVFPCPHCDGWEVRDQPLGVIAAQQPGALYALMVSNWSSDLVFCTNGPSGLDEPFLGLLGARGTVLDERPIARVAADDGGITVVFADGGVLHRRALFVPPQLRQPTQLPAQLGCQLTERGQVSVTAFGRTSVPGVYAAGDMAHPEGLIFPPPLAVVAAGLGAVAAGSIERELMVEDLGLPPSLLG
jgi:thioredoxin reductase